MSTVVVTGSQGFIGGYLVNELLKQGFKVKKAVTIGSGDIIQDILDDFVLKLKLNPKIAGMLKHHFEKKLHKTSICI